MFFSKDRKIKEITTARLRNGRLQNLNDMNDMNDMSIELSISLAMMRVTPSSSLKSIHGSNSAACLRATGFFLGGDVSSVQKNRTFVDSESI